MITAIQTYLPFLLVLAFAPGATAVGYTLFTHRDRIKTLLPEVQFEKATLEQAVTFLSQKTDVNIVIDPAVYAQATSPGVTALHGKPPSTAPPAGPPGRETPATGSTTPPADPTLITLHLKNVPLEVVLKYILRYKNLRYIVEDYAIVIVPIGRALPEEMKTEVFRLRTGDVGAARPIQRRATRSF